MNTLDYYGVSDQYHSFIRKPYELYDLGNNVHLLWHFTFCTFLMYSALKKYLDANFCLISVVLKNA